MAFLPVVAVFLTLMISTPVYAEFRYIYCLFTTLPFLASITFLAPLPNKTRRKARGQRRKRLVKAQPSPLISAGPEANQLASGPCFFTPYIIKKRPCRYHCATGGVSR